MQRLIVLLIIAGLGWYGYTKYEARRLALTSVPDETRIQSPQQGVTTTESAQMLADPKFKCDGRTHCSQMTSCEEATFFLKNCPGVKMDGNNDGIPCEKQWCKR